ARATRVSGQTGAGFDAAFWAAMTSGVFFLVVLLVLTFAATAWFVHDPGTIAQYRESISPSHFHEYHTHWSTITGFVIGETNDTALIGGLILLPLMSIAAGAVGALALAAA